MQWIEDVCWPFSCFVRVWWSVTKPAADGYLYIGWLTFKVRCKSMQDVFFFFVQQCWFLGVVSSPSLSFRDVDDHGGEQSWNFMRKRGGVIGCFFRNRVKAREEAMRQKAWKWACQCGLIELSVLLNRDIVMHADETLSTQIAQRSERRSKRSPFLSEVQNHAY